MRLLHTSDWHLGQTLHGAPRDFEHARFLSWLADTVEDESIDAVIVAGDVFDSGNPPPQALRLYFDFLGNLRARCPQVQIVILAGNHDSPARLGAPARLLAAAGVRVVGELPRDAAGEPNPDDILVPLTDATGETAALLVAVPYLRPSDVARAGFGNTGLVEGVRSLYGRLFEAAAVRQQGEAIVATGHCYMVGGAVSELSERRIQAGNQEALPVDIFPADLAYVALGHLHRPQPVGGREGVRYSGSPLPLSFPERAYEHEVRIVDLEGPRLAGSRARPVPRFVEIASVPEQHRPLDGVLELLRGLSREAPDGRGLDQRPFLEVRVLLDSVQPRLRAEVEAALDGAWCRLLRIETKYTGTDETLGDGVRLEHLKELDPVEVFARCYRQRFDGELPRELAAAFDELLEGAAREAGR